MKKWMFSIIAMLMAFPGLAQPVEERVYVTTDRNWYAAGETVYLSAFCADVRDGVRLSPVSAVAYVELSSADGPALTGKVALFQGRGAGSLDLPRTLPSGNYRLSTYTRLSPASSRIISVYNTLSTARVKDGVIIGDAPEGTPFPSSSDAIRADVRADGTLRLVSRKDASLSVSIFRNDAFPSYGSASLADALKTSSGLSAAPVPAEYDGEILTLRLSVNDGEVLVSRPGHLGDIYSAAVQPDGTARIYTGTLFGAGELVVTLEKDAPAFRAELDSPFRMLSPGPVPALVLDPSLEPRLSSLGVRMQLADAFDADTLYTRLPFRSLEFLQSEGSIRYLLDDYTRFATLQEVLTEYLADIRARRHAEEVELQIRCREREDGPVSFMEGASLILVDGVPVLQHELVYNLDPALLKAVDVYPFSYALGDKLYRGIANFITFKGDMGGIRFGNHVRVLDFDGPSYPLAFVPSPAPGYPNQRETVLWQPLVELQAGKELVLPLLQVDEGLVLVVEGLAGDGTPLYYRREL